MRCLRSAGGCGICLPPGTADDSRLDLIDCAMGDWLVVLLLTDGVGVHNVIGIITRAAFYWMMGLRDHTWFWHDSKQLELVALHWEQAIAHGILFESSDLSSLDWNVMPAWLWIHAVRPVRSPYALFTFASAMLNLALSQSSDKSPRLVFDLFGEGIRD